MPANDSSSGTSDFSRRSFVKTIAASAALAPLLRPAAHGATGGEELHLPLDRAATPLAVDGPHAFRSIRGRTGLHITSLKTKASVPTTLTQAPAGTLSLWLSPLEDLTFMRGAVDVQPAIPFEFPIVSDVFPGRNLRKARFGVFARGGYPGLLAKLAGGSMWERMDYGLAPFAYAERILLRQRYWYHLAITWDRLAREMFVYVNGIMVGHNPRAEGFEDPEPVLYLGNPMMVLSDLRLEPRALGSTRIQQRYQQHRPRENFVTEADWRAMVVPAFGRPLDLKRDASWRLAYECPFTNEAENRTWLQQGPGGKYRSEMRIETTAEGLYLKTPDTISNETRMYLWSPRTFEGDQWIELDCRIEGASGLALLVMCASGMQREDFFADHGVPDTGLMRTILKDLRNYHWEFFRRVEAMRPDVETQYLAKNPFGRRLHASCIPRLEQNRWYRLRFIKAGNRIHGSFDGNTVFDVNDSALEGNGPVYNFGRFGLRHMYATALRYRNLVVYERTPALAT